MSVHHAKKGRCYFLYERNVVQQKAVCLKDERIES